MSIKLPSLLSYTRSISPSVGLFYGVENIEDATVKSKRKPVKVTSVGLVSTISNYSEDIEKALANNGKNLQKTQMALIPESCNYCVMEFSINVSNNFKNPQNCNDINFRKEVNSFVKSYIESGKVKELAKLYLTNILTARYLFRNLSTSEKVRVIIQDNNNVFTFDSYSKVHTLAQFKKSEELEAIEYLTNELTDALSGTAEDIEGFKIQKIVNWKITAVFEAAPNSEVYPSQEYIEDNKEGKIISSLRIESNEDNQAVYHSQKIGNAIRTIDIWYPEYDAEERQYPLPVEPYGIDRTDESVQRKEENFYKYLAKVDEYNKKAPEDDVSNFIIACLVRGGVYSGGKEAKNKK